MTDPAAVAHVRPMLPGDTSHAVQVHLRAFQGYFLTFLGEAFLTELYQAILADPSGIALVHASPDDITGFVAGSTQPSGLYRRLLRQRWHRFAVAALPAVLRRPSAAVRLVRALRAHGQSTATPGTGTLMSLAVWPAAQGQGIGARLVIGFLDQARERGLSAVDLTTDAANNESTNRFYRNLGFQLSRTFTTPEGRLMNEYRIAL